MARRNRTPEENERRAKIRELLQTSGFTALDFHHRRHYVITKAATDDTAAADQYFASSTPMLGVYTELWFESFIQNKLTHKSFSVDTILSLV